MGMIERISRLLAIWSHHHAPDAWLAYQGVARLILTEMRTPTKAMAPAMLRTPSVYQSWRAGLDAALTEPDQTKPE